MIKLGILTLKNFLSIGAITQTVDFNSENLTLILGENLDLGGDGAKNGTGKTSILQGLSYALFGSGINNIKKDNLINRTNGKAMVVTLTFSVNDIEYRIERGRKPTFLKFYVNNQEIESQETNDSQGDSRETQDAIERVLHMSADMFRHIVGLNTYNEPFLSLRANDQRVIIEQLLGVTILSEKADAIKILNKQTKDNIQQEEFRVRALEEANKRIHEQIESLKKRQRLWNLKHQEDLSKLISEYDELSSINIEVELRAHKDLAIYNECLEKKNRYDSLIARQSSWEQTKTKEIKSLQLQLDKLNSIDIEVELQSHKDLILYNQKVNEQSVLKKEISRIKLDHDKELKISKKIKSEIETLKENKCYACKQDFHDVNHQSVLTTKNESLEISLTRITELNNYFKELNDSISELGDIPTTHYENESDAIKHGHSINNIVIQIENKKQESDPFIEHINELSASEIICGDLPLTHYDTEEQAIKHSSRMSSLLDQISNKHNETDPYIEQISEMSSEAIQTVSFDKINDLSRVMQHQEYLLDLLVNKKSFVRKKIIEQNLSYLNSRLSFYLDSMGLPHTVVFQNDLTVEITELGRELDFDNCSRGERTRIILGLSFAFRDVYESLYNPINVLFVDELIDSGLDTIGVENAISLLKDMSRRRNKSVWLVSHRDELTNRVSNVLKVIKTGGFTEYNMEVSV